MSWIFAILAALLGTCFILNHGQAIPNQKLVVATRETLASLFRRSVMAVNVKRTRKCIRPTTCSSSTGSILTKCPLSCTVVDVYPDRDFLVILDSSGSISPSKYAEAKLDLAWIVTHLCGNLGSDLKVGGMQFSRWPEGEFAFNAYGSMASLWGGVTNMDRQGSITRTFFAFTYAKDIMFTLANGMRAGSIKQALVITDGRSNGVAGAAALSTAAAAALKASGVEVFALAIGITKPASIAEIRTYASLPLATHVFSVPSVEELGDLVDDLQSGPADPCVFT